eukprot:TRINITY_DN277_c0_g1_i3.p1 TRINITY_DN277_c0_g1~~TRINITY_DN277_c0_g1_i3.p1  ORF type:complete len:481 (-),score=73.12 TRINITY_DN277_c0_g1_i3:78-1520(-)
MQGTPEIPSHLSNLAQLSNLGLFVNQLTPIPRAPIEIINNIPLKQAETLQSGPIDQNHNGHSHHEGTSSDEDTAEKRQIKRVLRRVTQACLQCQRGHLSCDRNRPCQRCIERSRPCEDGEPKRRGRKKRSKDEETPNQTPIQTPYQGSFHPTLQTSFQVQPHQSPQPVSQTQPTATPSLPFLANLAAIPNTVPTSLLSLNRSDLTTPSATTSISTLGMPMGPEIPLQNGNREETQESFDVFSDILFSSVDQHMKWYPQAPTWGEQNQEMKSFENEVLKVRLPDLFTFLKSERECAAKLISLTNQGLTQHGLNLMEKELQFNLPIFKSTIDQLGCPALLWERGMTIHHVNQSFRDCTGFSDSIPARNFALANEMSDEGLRHYVVGRIQSLGVMSGKDSWSFPCSFLNHHPNAPSKYVDGTFSVTAKIGSLGFGLFFIGIFLPSTPSFAMRPADELPWGDVYNCVASKIRDAARVLESKFQN